MLTGRGLRPKDTSISTVNPIRTVSQQPRAFGAVDLCVRASPRGSEVDGLRQSGAYKALFPRPSGSGIEAVLINTAGGVTGGDRFQLHVTARAKAHLTLTTQAAERAYRAQPGQTGRVSTQLTVEAGARLNWLPQETILFQGCAFERSLQVDLTPDARFLMVEPVLFGRKAMGETLRSARFHDRVAIHRAGEIAYLDQIRLTGDIAARLGRRDVGAGAAAMASVVFAAPNAGAHLTDLRDMAGDLGGVSLVRDDLLTLRLLAPDGYLLRQTLIPILTLLTETNMPRAWMT